MFKNFKIGTRLIVSYFSMAILTILLALIALTGLKKSNNDLNYFIEHPFSADTAIKMCRIEVNVAARTIREMLIDNDKSSFSVKRQKVAENISMVRQNLDILSKSYTRDDGLFEQYSTDLNNWIAIGEKTMSEIEKGNLDNAKRILIEECSPSLENLVIASKKLNENTVTMQKESLNKNELDTQLTSIIVLILVVISVLFSIIIASLTTKSILRPTAEMENAVKQLSNGILDTEILYTSKDELGSMADSLRSSMKALSIYINDIDNVLSLMSSGNFNITPPTIPFVGQFKHIEDSFVGFSEKMSYVLREINSTSDEVAAGANNVSYGAQVLSQGSSEQSSSIQLLSTTISEILSQTNQNSQNAQLAKGYAEKTVAEVFDSNNSMNDMILAMNQINEKSTEISKIIKTIEDIAFQTNILALNAAVEAARAGASGKGFAVVADEVRNLAGKSAEAAKNTTLLIESTVRAVENGTKIADDTARSMLGVVAGTKEITELISSIAYASEIQANSVSDVTDGIDKISSVILNNSATAQQSAASSEELSGQAQMLKNLVSKFKTKDTSLFLNHKS